MNTQNKKRNLTIRFLKLLQKSGFCLSEETQERWNVANFDDQIKIIKDLAINKKNLCAATALLEFSQGLVERMELQETFMTSWDYKNISYCFKAEKIKNKMEDVMTEIVSLGGQFVLEPSTSKSNIDIYITVGFVNQFTAWDFHRKYKAGEYYKYSNYYEEELYEINTMNAINNGDFVWDYQSVKELFHSSGHHHSRGTPSDWIMLTVLLRIGSLDVTVEECVIPTVPDDDENNFNRKKYIEASTSTRGNDERGFLAYCAWNWLNQMGGDDADFPNSLCNVISERLNICIKIGDADPYQIVKFLFPQYKTYVHMPYFSTPTIIVIKPNAQFISFINGDVDLCNLVDQECG